MDQKKLSYDERIRRFNFMAVHSGMYAELGKERVFLLMAILQFGISEGEYMTTTKELAQLLGITERTVRKNVRSLLGFRWKGKPIISLHKSRYFDEFGDYEEYDFFTLHLPNFDF